MRANEQSADVVPGLKSFQAFQKQLKASEPESPPKVENLTLVDSSWDTF